MTSPLAQSLQLPCGTTIPNRIGKSAMTEGLADEHDNPTQAHLNLYGTWSDGGCGLHITGNVMIDRRYLERAGNVVVEDEQALPMLKQWAQASTHAGNQCWMQISHPGRQCPKMINSTPMSPSNVRLNMLGNFGQPKAMTDADIEDVIQRFATTASIAQKAGFTGVQLHCAHGYLISQFLSPITNQRHDQWGGSLENRARLARRAVQAIRKAVGPKFPVAVKLNSADFQKGGFSLSDCVSVARWLSEDGIDLLEISGGTYEQLSLMGVEPTEVRESTRKREAYFIEYANAIKTAAQVPLMITGGFRSRDVMEKAVADGEVDMIGIARPLCTQPNLGSLLVDQWVGAADSFENSLALGTGFWGHNSPLGLIKGINSFGQVGFYYWQIIRLSQHLPPQTDLGVLRAFMRHIRNDIRLTLRRKKQQKTMSATSGQT